MKFHISTTHEDNIINIECDSVDEYKQALQILATQQTTISADIQPLSIQLVHAPAPTPCSCEADRPAPPPIPDGSVNPTTTPFMERAHPLNPSLHASMFGSADLNAHTHNVATPDPTESLANAIEHNDHMKADRELQHMRERLSNANSIIDNLRTIVREQDGELGRVIQEREKAAALYNEVVDLITKHDWSPETGKMPVDQLSEWLDAFVAVTNERNELKRQLTKAAEINAELRAKY